MRLPPGGGRLWPGILPPQPATTDGESATYRKSAKCLNEKSALALRTETFFSYNYIEELYAF